ncbi:hypothetical protein GIB67_036429 [Kingdonia uniflora]|uniref:Myb/SANT-like domain-containing protein n=1 Tax=Kingdonia uniflora TaxID=39325 RepID=A0A7J7L4A0_9MAGN|nr:hypothetical protein GIB67_036429 [Kingdonia uniflora]
MVEIPAQVLGSITGVKLILQTFPEVGHAPRLNVDLHHGEMTEGLLTFVIISISLGLAKNNPNSFFMKTWISSISKLALHILGSDLTGGCMQDPPMDNAGTSNNNRGRTEWTPQMDRYFLDLMLEQALLDQSGFGCDDEKHMVTVDSYIWDEYLKHPETKPMRTKTMPNYHDLDKICGKSTATGQYARSAKDLKFGKLSDVNITQVQDSSDDTAVEEDSLHVNNEVEKTKKKKKHKLSKTTSTAEDIKKWKGSTGEGMINALKSIASAVHGMKNRRSESEKKLNVIEELDAIFSLLEGDCLKACDLLEDEGKMRMFLNLAENKRKTW